MLITFAGDGRQPQVVEGPEHAGSDSPRPPHHSHPLPVHGGRRLQQPSVWLHGQEQQRKLLHHCKLGFVSKGRIDFVFSYITPTAKIPDNLAQSNGPVWDVL